MDIEEILRNVKSYYLVLRLRELKHRLTYKRYYKRMAQAMERFHECNNKKPSRQIRREMGLCKKFWGCYPLHYFRYDLYKQDKQLTEQELIDYIPEFFFYVLFLPFYYPGEEERVLSDKIRTEQFFRSLGIPQPPTICKIIKNRVYNNRLCEIDFETIAEKIEEEKYKKIFVKPSDGAGGYGIYIFNRVNEKHYVNSNNVIFDEGFLNQIGKRNDYIIQPGLEQEESISRIYPHSINTFRIVTENKNGHVSIVCSVLRMGRGGKQVDNISQDGLILKIDKDGGRCGGYATTEQCEYFEKHPDTNFVFQTYRISCWDKIEEFVIKNADKLPQFVYIGWDIALTKKGPLAIEGNLAFGLDLYQIPLGGLKEQFKIGNPEFYYRNIGKKIVKFSN